jgi:hypothetical protein
VNWTEKIWLTGVKADLKNLRWCKGRWLAAVNEYGDNYSRIGKTLVSEDGRNWRQEPKLNPPGAYRDLCYAMGNLWLSPAIIGCLTRQMVWAGKAKYQFLICAHTPAA